jgi:uncharacterized protein
MSAPRSVRKSFRSPARGAVALAAFFILLWPILGAPARALEFPALTGRVIDDANILDPATRAALTDKLADLEAKTTDQLVVVTLKSLQGTSIEEFGVALGRHWQIGQKDKNNGVLLIVAPNERKARIEVGYGLESSLTDAVTRLIIENAVPRFRANDFAGGITRAVDDIISVLTGDAEEWKQRAAHRPDATPDWGSLLIFILIVAVFLIIFFSMARSAAPRRGRRWGPWIVVPGPSSGGSWGGGSGGGSWGGGFSDGGFSGGGGDFGGGGSSGSW